MGVAWGKTGENEESVQACVHVKHSFTGEQVNENEKLCSDLDFFNTESGKVADAALS